MTIENWIGDARILRHLDKHGVLARSEQIMENDDDSTVVSADEVRRRMAVYVRR